MTSKNEISIMVESKQPEVVAKVIGSHLGMGIKYIKDRPYLKVKNDRIVLCNTQLLMPKTLNKYVLEGSFIAKVCEIYEDVYGKLEL